MGITASGVGSGLDIEGLITQLMQAEARPLSLLQTKEATFNNQVVAYNSIKGLLGSLKTSAQTLAKATTFQGTKVSVPNDAPFTATSENGALTGSFSVAVRQLATTQRIAMEAGSNFKPSDGTLKITFGTVTSDGSTFVGDPERTVSLDFKGETLEELRDAINADKNLGLKASIVDNGKDKQIVLSSSTTGEDKAFKIEGTGGLEDLSFTPGTNATNDKMYSIQKAQNALLTVDGMDISRSSNTVKDVIDGVTLTLNKVSDKDSVTDSYKPSTFSVTDDTASAKKALQEFVDNYNELTKAINQYTYFDKNTKQGSVLTGDSVTRSLQTQLRSVMNDTLGALGGVNGLAALGITQKPLKDGTDGTLIIDNAKLDKALADEELDLAAFFAGSNGVKGFGAKLEEKITSFISTSSDGKTESGLLADRTKGIDKSIDSLVQQSETLLRRLESTEKMYRKQFSSLDTLLASMQSTSSFLTQQLANLPGVS